MDLSKLDTRAACEAGVRIDLHFPGQPKRPLTDDEGVQMFIVGFGVDSVAYRTKRWEILNRRAGERADDEGDRNIRTQDEIDADTIEVLAGVVTDWHLQLEGNNPSPDVDTIRDVLERFPWIRDQLDIGLADRAKILGNGSGA